MAQYDVAVGLQPPTLDKGIAQLYSKSDAREKLFKGTQTGNKDGIEFTAAWDIQQSPTFAFAPPPDDKWAASINAQGVNPKPADKPTVNAVQVQFAQFHAEYTMLGKTVQGTGQVIAFATVSIANNLATITPAAIWVDETNMKLLDKVILNKAILPQVLAQLTTALAGIQIPPLTFTEQGVTIALTPPQVTVVNNTLVLGASLQSKGTVDLSGVTWPNQPFFVLIGPDVIKSVAAQITAKLENWTYSPPEEDYKGVLKYSYSISIANLDTISDQTDRTKLRVETNVAFSAEMKPLGIGGPCSVTAASQSLK